MRHTRAATTREAIVTAIAELIYAAGWRRSPSMPTGEALITPEECFRNSGARFEVP